MGWLPPINWCRISSIHRMIQQWIWQKMKKWILMILEPPRTTWRLLVLCVFGVTQPPWWSNICCRTTWWQPMDHQNALDSRRWSYLPWQHEWQHDLQGFKRFHQEKLVVFIVRKPPWLDGLWEKPSKLWMKTRGSPIFTEPPIGGRWHENMARMAPFSIRREVVFPL